jgi:hypothetical protein
LLLAGPELVTLDKNAGKSDRVKVKEWLSPVAEISII